MAMRISISAAVLIASACLLPAAASAATGAYMCAFTDVYEMRDRDRLQAGLLA